MSDEKKGGGVLFWPLALVLAISTAAAATAELSPEEVSFMIAKGRVTFKIYCQNCHGEEGQGDGKLAELLKIPPANLTQLAKLHGGRFSREKVTEAIDGRAEVRGHGIREMPVWGYAFRDSLRPTWKELSDEERAEAKIEELVYFIESIQEEGE